MHHRSTDRHTTDIRDYTADELRVDSPDYALRAHLRADINSEIQARALTRPEAHKAIGLPPRALDDHSLSTERLYEVLDAFRALPGGGYRLHFDDYRRRRGPGWSTDWPIRCAL